MNAALFVQPSRMDQKLCVIMNQLKCQFDDYKYTVYRSAAKMVALQKMFHTSNIPYRVVLAILDRNKMNENNMMMPPFQLISLLNDIFAACERLGHFNSSFSTLQQQHTLLANFFWDVFDPHRRHTISLLEIKITFLLLCKLYATDQLSAEFYNLLRDEKTKCVPKLNFECLVNTLSKLFAYIGENEAYGKHNVSIVMDQCFTRFQSNLGLLEDQFLCLWSSTQTRFLIYANLVALVKRIEDTEKLVHNNECTSCQIKKIVGIRFKCQTCRNLSLCLRCFATGYATNRNHKCGHRMYEVFTEDLPPRRVSHYFAKLCDMFLPSRQSDDAKGLCSSNEISSLHEAELATIPNHNAISRISTACSILDSNAIQQNKRNVSSELNSKCFQKPDPSLFGLTTSANNATNVSERLQALIDRLLRQNDKLETQLEIVKTATHEEICVFLKAHKQFLTEIINEMRNFTAISQPIIMYPVSSTPCRKDIPMACSITKSNYLTVPNTKRDSNLTHSIYGADINRSYVEANRSDYSLKDVSIWFSKHSHRLSIPSKPLHVVQEISNCDHTETHNTEISNFRLLLQKVKEMLEDSYSDNTELAEATQNLENVLDNIIQTEETRRKSM